MFKGIIFRERKQGSIWQNAKCQLSLIVINTAVGIVTVGSNITLDVKIAKNSIHIFSIFLTSFICDSREKQALPATVG